jgi:hypothetical protein
VREVEDAGKLAAQLGVVDRLAAVHVPKQHAHRVV